MKTKIITALMIMLLIVSAGGCGFARNLSLDLAETEQKNVETLRQVSIISLQNWPFISGVIKGALSSRMDEMPENVINAIEELDRLSAKYAEEGDAFTDEDLGMALGYRVHILCTIIREAIELYAPELLEYVPLII